METVRKIMRPSIGPLLTCDRALEYFMAFCKSVYISESLECIVDIMAYTSEMDSLAKNMKLGRILDNYISVDGSSMINIPHHLRNRVMELDSNTDMILDEIKSELMLMLEYRIPHFTVSSYWNEFTSKYPYLIKYCISADMSMRLEAIRFRKKDFMKDTFTHKEDELCQLLKEDMSMFELKSTEHEGSLAIYLFDGKHILDEKDIGLGRFQGFKVSGIIPYPPWLVMMCLSSTTFHSRIWDGTKFDDDGDYSYIEGMKDQDGNIINYDTHICKLIIDYGKLLDYRSCYVITNNLYKNNTTYLLTRSIQPDGKKYKANYMHDGFHKSMNYRDEARAPLCTNPSIIDMKEKGRKRAVYVPNISMAAVQPVGKSSTAITFINLLNPGGLLLSKMGTPEKRMMKIASNYRRNIVREMDNVIKNSVNDMEEVYEMVRTKLDLYKGLTGTTKPHIFDRSFKEAIKSLC